MNRQQKKIRESALFGVLQQCLQVGDHPAARQACERLLKKVPGDPELLTVMGQLYYLTGEFSTALDFFRRSVLIMPRQPNAHYYAGLCRMLLDENEAAVHELTMALEQSPGWFDAHINRGNIYRKEGRWSEALKDYQKCLQLNPGAGNTYNNIGVVHMDQHQYEQARGHFDKAISLEPGFLDPQFNLGRVCQFQGDYQAAFKQFREVHALNPDFAPAYLEEAFMHYRLNCFDKFWPLYDQWRWVGLVDGPDRFQHLAPVWQGQSPVGHLLLWAEQGVGDEIVHASLLADLLRASAQLTLTVDPRLLPIFQRSFPEIVCLARGTDPAPEGPFDYQLPIASLARYLRPNSDSFADQPQAFLQADRERANAINARLPKRPPAGVRCGIAWRSANRLFGRDKSLTLAGLAPLLTLGDIQLIDLQYGDTGEERRQFAETVGVEVVHDVSVDLFNDLDGLMALISTCDVVVTASNVTAHAAAALGKPVFLLLSRGGGRLFYWHHYQGRCLWYPTVTVCEQSAPGDWSGAIESALRGITANLPPS